MHEEFFLALIPNDLMWMLLNLGSQNQINLYLKVKSNGSSKPHFSLQGGDS